MTAATASFHRALDRASHHAIGVPMRRRSTVVVDASASVNLIGDQSSASEITVRPECYFVPYPNFSITAAASGPFMNVRNDLAASFEAPVFSNTASCRIGE